MLAASVRNCAFYPSSFLLTDLAQGREIVFHDILKSVWVEHVVDVGEHPSDVAVPVLHALVELKLNSLANRVQGFGRTLPSDRNHCTRSSAGLSFERVAL